jgi:hypothetical protein
MQCLLFFFCGVSERSFFNFNFLIFFQKIIKEAPTFIPDSRVRLSWHYTHPKMKKCHFSNSFWKKFPAWQNKSLSLFEWLEVLPHDGFKLQAPESSEVVQDLFLQAEKLFSRYIWKMTFCQPMNYLFDSEKSVQFLKQNTFGTFTGGRTVIWRVWYCPNNRKWWNTTPIYDF